MQILGSARAKASVMASYEGLKMKGRAYVCDTYAEIVDACRKAWHLLTDDPDRIQSLRTRGWATVNG